MSGLSLRITFIVLTLFALAAPTSAEAPLPPGVAVRFGSTRFLYDGWITDVAYTPDGLTLITGAVSKSGPNAGHSQLIFWNAATGERRHESNYEEGDLWNVILSPDGRTVATRYPGKQQFLLYDTDTGEMLGTVGQRSYGSPVFSPDSKVLGGGVGKTMQLWDIATGAEVGTFEGHTSNLSWMAYSPSGKHLASVSGDHTMRLWDVDSGEVLQQQEDEERYWNFVEFTPDGQHVGATSFSNNEDKPSQLTVWSVSSGAETLSVPVTRSVQGFVYSADGKSLVIAELNNVEVREAATGKLQRRFTLGGPAQSRSWTISHDGLTLAAGGAGCVVHQWDLTTGTLKDNAPGHRFPIRSVAVAGDGATVMSQDTSGAIRLWDPATGRELRRLPAPMETRFAPPFSPNGRIPYFCRLEKENTLTLFDFETGKERSRLEIPAGEPREMVTTADGGVLALWMVNGEGVPEVGIWDAATGKKRRDIDKVPGDLAALAISPNGTRLAGVATESIQIWDTATGRIVHTIEVDRELQSQSLRFSADGRRLLAVGRETTLGIWDIDTGRRVLFTKLEGSSIYSAALSPDGRTIAVAPLQDEVEPAAVLLLEAETGQERCRLSGHSRANVGRVSFAAHALAFTPDGRSLITTGSDATALVWTLPYRAGERALSRRNVDLPARWDALADESERAYRALADLTTIPDLAVPMLREHLRPIPPLDEKARKQISLWITDLDSEDFTAREKAAAALEKLEELAAPQLRRAMANDPGPEVKRHLKRLLDRLTVEPPPAEMLRSIRAIESLERMGTADARKLLEELAAGAPEASRTREALATLARLKGRKGM